MFFALAAVVSTGAVIVALKDDTGEDGEVGESQGIGAWPLGAGGSAMWLSAEGFPVEAGNKITLVEWVIAVFLENISI